MILITYPFKRKSFDAYNILRSDMFEEGIILGYQNEEFSAYKHRLIYGKVNCFTYTSVADIVDHFIGINEDIYYLPIEEDLTLSFLEFQENASLGRIKFVLPNIDTYRLVRDKFKLASYCKDKGFGVPKIYGVEEAFVGLEKTELLLKPRIGSGSRGIQRIFSNVELAHFEYLDNDFFLQEIMPNSINVEAVNFFAKDGVISAVYGHRRLRTHPASGGVSVLSECYLKDDAFDFVVKLVGELNYSGLAMVEFLRDSDGNLRLIEINPRIWGSILLSYDVCPHLFMEYIYHCKNEKSMVTPARVVEIAFKRKLLWVLPYGLSDYIKVFFSRKEKLLNYTFINFSLSNWNNSFWFLILIYGKALCGKK